MSTLVLSIVYVLYNIAVSGFDKILAQYFIICILCLINIGTRPSSPYTAFKYVFFLTFRIFIQQILCEEIRTKNIYKKMKYVNYFN